MKSVIAILTAIAFGVAVIYLKLGPPESTVDTKAAPGLVQLELDDLEKRLLSLPGERREKVLSDPGTFEQFVRAEAARQSILAAIRAREQSEDAWRSERRYEDFQVRQFMQQRAGKIQIPADYPPEQAIREFYNNNKQHFRIGPRLALWQIMLRIPQDADPVDEAKIMQQASALHTRLQKDKARFAELAMQYSQHEPTRINGGFMGIVAVNALSHAVRGAILKLKPDEISAPIRAGSGIYIYRRGQAFPPIQQTLEQARPRVVEILRNNLRDRKIQQINRAVLPKYPVELHQDQWEKWRKKLQNSGKT